MICSSVARLIDYAVKTNLITPEDVYVVRNKLMDALSLTDWVEGDCDSGELTVDEILSPIIEYAVEQGIIADTANSRDLFDTKIMGILMPPKARNSRIRNRRRN